MRAKGLAAMGLCILSLVLAALIIVPLIYFIENPYILMGIWTLSFFAISIFFCLLLNGKIKLKREKIA